MLVLRRFCWLLLPACHSTDHPTGLPTPAPGLTTLRGTWLLDAERSRGDTLAYRPNTYRFRFRPQGRPGFQLDDYGRFVRYDVAAGDGGGLLAQEGTWQETTTNRLLIHLPDLDPAEPDYELQVLGYQAGVLRLRRLAGRPAVEIIRTP